MKVIATIAFDLCRTVAVLSICALLTTGCAEKKTETQSVPLEAAAENAATARASETDAPTVPIPVVNMDTRLAEAEAARKARDYEKAVETLIALEGQRQLTEQQAAAISSQMRQFQSELANALAAGDPKAKAAADKLRAASTR